MTTNTRNQSAAFACFLPPETLPCFQMDTHTMQTCSRLWINNTSGWKPPHICCIHIYRKICYRQKSVQYKGNYYNSFWLTKYLYFLFFRQFLKIIPHCSHTIPMFQLYFSKSCIYLFFRCPHIFTGTLAYVQSIGLVTNIWANTVHTLMITSGFKTWKWHWLHNVVPRTTGLPKAAFILYIKPSTSPCII